MNSEVVKAWMEEIVIPTYPVGEPEKNPMFLEKRVYQGSSGVVYPNAVIEKIEDYKIDQVYKAVFIENQYLKIMILPQLGGRIQMAFDKIANRHFVYYNSVIKPALVGLTGPWISGGIEFNWPQHHRPSTFEPIDHKIVENEDGSKTVWVNEVEKMFRTKGMAGFTLYPDKAYLEIKGRIYNRTPFPQTFLWWANPAVKVNDHYQSVFPPDVHAVYDHGKRDVSAFPISKSVYYKVDYGPGTDISRYKNIPVPTSYMAVSSKFNFVGGYENDSRAGLLHVAEHRIAPGKKQWTWGNGDFGKAWDANLTDADGPYIELMTGVFTDNQPDFAWIQPYEEKTFEQYFMPYREVGMVKNATKDVLVNLTIENEVLNFIVFTTSVYNNLKIEIKNKQQVIFQTIVSVSPQLPFRQTLSIDKEVVPEDFALQVTDIESNYLLITYKPLRVSEPEVPLPAEAAKAPSEIESNEQLFLTGLHLEQYRHASFSPFDYYEEALKRDPKDARVNNALGLLYLRKGQFDLAESHLQKSIKTITQRNPNPYDGEAYYNLGVAFFYKNQWEQAYNAFYKCIWNDAWQHAGYLWLAKLSMRMHDYANSLYLINKSILKNGNSHTAIHVKVCILRSLGRLEEACNLITASLAIDPFNYGCLYERYLVQNARGDNQASDTLIHLYALADLNINTLLEYVIDYANMALYTDAISLLQKAETHAAATTWKLYYLGWLNHLDGNLLVAQNYFQKAAAESPDYIFPNKLEDMLVFQRAILLNPQDSNAFYFLGNFWYDKRQYDQAIDCWKQSAHLNPDFATVQRNLALALFNKKADPKMALKAMETAFYLSPSHPRMFLEFDQLLKQQNTNLEKRLQLFRSNQHLVIQRDDLFLEFITILNQIGLLEEALALMTDRKFHPWEGGEGMVAKQYQLTLIELAKKALKDSDAETALNFLTKGQTYPSNLGEGKLPNVLENDILYWKGIAYEAMGESERAVECWKEAAKGNIQLALAVYYNDTRPDLIFYQGMALNKLGHPDKSIRLFHDLIHFGKENANKDYRIDYFAVSLPGMSVFEPDFTVSNKAFCYYLIGLGYLGLGRENIEKAIFYFDKTLELDSNHQGAIIHKEYSLELV